MANAVFTVSKNASGASVLSFTPGDNTAQNTLFNTLVNSFNTATPGTYKQILESIASKTNSTDLSKLLPQTELNKVTGFYVSKNITTPWDATKQGINPPTGSFDPAYYGAQNPALLKQWEDSFKSVSFGGLTLPDVDVTSRYTKDTFLHQHYSTTGKSTGLRGNAVEEAAAAKTYTEQRAALTDAERQAFRDTFLGIGKTTGKAPIDATIEQIVNQENQNKFNVLVQDVLTKTIQEVNKARQKESTLGFLGGLPGFDEVVNLKANLSNSLLGDSGIGGYLAISGQGDVAKGLEKGVQSMLGLGNSVSYNWQKWFDEELATKYANLQEVADPADAKKVYKIDQAFSKQFVDEYLKPRFDNSKSMSEFISYMDVKEDEQNVLQTQTVSNKLKELGIEKADVFLTQLASGSIGYFDPEFYFNPAGAKEKEGLYTKQKTDVAAAWNQAKTTPSKTINGLSWDQWAYKYGLDLKDKEQFAKLHYEVVGKPLGYDPSSDKPTNVDLYNYINNELTPYLASAKEAFGDSVFLQFMTPDQLADQLLRSIDPLKTPEAWDKTLKQYGIDGTGKTIDEVKRLILEATRTAPAENIRESLRELNEKKITPTQKNLGIEYIQRESDDVTKSTGKETALYSLFKNSGYGGTEDEFYRDFMPDVNKEDQDLITGVLKGDKSKLGFNIDTSDPFASIASIESFFSDSTSKPSVTKDQPDYFSLFGEAEKKASQTSTSSSPFDIFNF